MKIIKQKETRWVETAPSTTVEEYVMQDGAISGATAIIDGRYPEKGYARNTVSRELVLVISGSGYIGSPGGKKIPLVIGDCILVLPNEKFYWDGHMALFMACSPAWDAAQHRISP